MNGWIFVTGSSSGLGKEIAMALHAQGQKVYGLDISPTSSGGLTDGCHCDIRSRSSVQAAVQTFNDAYPGEKVSALINNAAMNHIDWFPDLQEDDWDRVMDTNAKGIFLLSQALLPNLEESRGTILNIVSNAAHVAMRCSLAYNASKAAAHMMTLQMARELGGAGDGSKGLTVFGVAPNKLAGTGMSDYIDASVPRTRGWTPEEAEEYQRQQLGSGEETDPRVVAEFIAYLLEYKERHRYLNGCILPYGV